MTLAMSGATPEDAGLASGLVNTTVQVGGALGLAVLATLVGDRDRRAAAPPASPRAAALNGGYHLAYAVGAGLVLVAIAIAVVVIKPERQAKREARAQVEGRRREPAYSKAA